MPISFRCSSCEHQLSTARRKAGTSVICPRCNTWVAVPSPGDDNTTSTGSVAELEVAPVAVFCSDPVATAVEPLVAPSRPSQFVPAAAALLIAGGLLAAFIYLSNQDRSESAVTQKPTVRPVSPLLTSGPGRAAPKAAAPLPAEASARKSPLAEEEVEPAKPVATALPPPAPKDVAPPIPPPLTEPAKPVEIPAPVPPVAKAPPPLEPVQLPLKRRSHLSDEDLRKQLLSAPEVGLDLRSFTRVAAAANQPTRRPVEHGPLALALRPDLATLPLRMGADCQVGKEWAENLHVLSRRLRSLLEGASPASNPLAGLLPFAGLPLPGGSSMADPRPNAETLRERLLGTLEKRDWAQPEAVPTLMQLLMAENRPIRLVLVDALAQIKGREASEALAQRAVFDIAPEVRDAAVVKLGERPRDEYRPVLVDALRYPWPAAADHAAEALVALRDREAVPALASLLKEPNPAVAPLRIKPDQEKAEIKEVPEKEKADPVKPEKENADKLKTGSKVRTMIREVVRVNHLTNCLLCHAPSTNSNDLVRGRVPLPGQSLPAPSTTPAYYEGSTGMFVRADITYLRQDFSVHQPVPQPGVWPGNQRFDYMVRTRPAYPAELNKLALKKKDKSESAYEQRDAVLFALRGLTGKDFGVNTEGWEHLAQPALKPVKE